MTSYDNNYSNNNNSGPGATGGFNDPNAYGNSLDSTGVTGAFEGGVPRRTHDNFGTSDNDNNQGKSVTDRVKDTFSSSANRDNQSGTGVTSAFDQGNQSSAGDGTAYDRSNDTYNTGHTGHTGHHGHKHGNSKHSVAFFLSK
jgi:hypothetical protein